MMKKQLFQVITFSFIFIGGLYISSCKPNAKQEKISRINELEKLLFETKKGVVDKNEASNMILAYTQYADAYPEDSISAEYLFKAADVSINTFHSIETIELFDRIINNYPHYRKTPQALFLKAFAYENYIGQLDSARAIYQLFLEKYPHHDFYNDAQISLDNLGKTPEEIIKEFQSRQEE